MTDPFDEQDDLPSGADRPPSPDDPGLSGFGGDIPLDPDDIEVWLASARRQREPLYPDTGSDETRGSADGAAAGVIRPTGAGDTSAPGSGEPAVPGDDMYTFGMLTDEGTARPVQADVGPGQDEPAGSDELLGSAADGSDHASESREDLGFQPRSSGRAGESAEQATNGGPGDDTGDHGPTAPAAAIERAGAGPRDDGWGLADPPQSHAAAAWPVAGRAVRWAQRPWTDQRIIMFAVTTLTLVVTTAVMMRVTHMWSWPLTGTWWQPWSWRWEGVSSLVFRDNTPTGGDMGAHVWGSAYLRDELLPNWQLSGWSMDWYAGLPAYRFYMVLPALAIVAFNVMFPYGVAFKLVAVSGLLLFPVSCWSFGRLARFRYPVPELFAVAGVCFVLDESFEILGGNLKSTMAGEFSFSIALTLAMFGLGLLARGLETGRYRVRVALLLAAASVSHGIVLIFVMVGAVALTLVWLIVTLDVKRLYYALTTGAATLLLSAFWVGPFLGNHTYMTDMKYEPKPSGSETFWELFFPLTTPLNILITGFAAIGVISVVLRRQVNGVALTLTGLVFVAGVYVFRDGGLPFDVGLLWNPRLLPFVYLVRYLLMMIGIVELVTTLGNIFANRPGALVASVRTRTVTWGVVALVVYLVIGFMYQVLPGGNVQADGRYAWGPFRATETAERAQGAGWSRYNFTGYEGRDHYGEYHGVVQTMAALGEDRGCGRAFWENHEDNGQYGTTMALMLLPYWTDGCIGSMEGLYFEASGTTPYHFVSAAAMSESSSNPVRELRYTSLDADAGTRQLQSLGVRYVMLRTDAAKQQVEGRGELTYLAETGPWSIYELAGSDIVVPLDVEPVVVDDRGGDRRERNLELGMSWFQNPDDWPVMPANDGPDHWQRVDAEVDVTRREFRVGDERSVRWSELVARIEDGQLESPRGLDPTATIEQLAELAPNERTTLLEVVDDDAGGDPWHQPIQIRTERYVEVVQPGDRITPRALDPVAVTDVEVGQQSLSFGVDQVGVPVLVRVSYFPNWTASGADGPYRIGPNMMVVVPTDNEVELNYRRGGSDIAFYVATLLGILLCIGLWHRRRREAVTTFPPDTWYDDGTWEWGNDENALVNRHRALPGPMRSLPPGSPPEPPGGDDGSHASTTPVSPPPGADGLPGAPPTR